MYIKSIAQRIFQGVPHSIIFNDDTLGMFLGFPFREGFFLSF
jgi:hypothetical protein